MPSRAPLLLLLAVLGLTSCQTTTFPNFSHWDTRIPSIDRFPETVPAAIHRCSRGYEVDELYRRRAVESRRRPDFLWGAYHFCTGWDVDRQLNLAMDLVGQHPGGPYRTLMVFDFERNVKSRTDYMKVAELAELIRKFHARTGVYPVLYVNPGWVNERLKVDRYTRADLQIIRRCPLWTSSYRAEPADIHGLHSWTMWQYAGDDTLPGYGDFAPLVEKNRYPRGIAGVGPELEMNLFKGNEEALRKFWLEHSIPTRW